MVMLSLYALSTEASLKDLHNLKKWIKVIPKRILYDLVCKCFTKPKKKLAFQVLLQNWPFNIFAVQLIGVKLAEEDVILIASSMQQGRFGSIAHLDLVHKDFGCLDKRATDAFLKVLTETDPLLNIENYASTSKVSYSYQEAMKYAENYVHNAGDTAEVKHENDMVESGDKPFKPGFRKELNVYLELVVNSTNFHKVMEVLSVEYHELYNLIIKITTVRLAFEYVPAKEISKVMEAVHFDQVRGIDLSFNCLSSLNNERLLLVTESLKRFGNLENICLAYNGIDPSECHILTNCLKLLPNIKRLDLSWNRLGKQLSELFSSDLRSPFLHELILTGCDMTKSVLNALADCEKVSCLCKLKLDQNNFSGRRKNALIRALVKFKSTLTYLDISCCGFGKEDVLHICSMLQDFNELHSLLVYPNPGVTDDIILQDVLPLLKDLPKLKVLPPISELRAEHESMSVFLEIRNN